MKTVSLEQEINPWEAQSARFNFAAPKLNLDEGLWKVLQYPNRDLIVHIPVSMDTYSMHNRKTVTAVVTGKPINIGGSRGRREATGRGIMIVCDEAVKKLGLTPEQTRVIVQGFGNVGSNAALLMSEAGYRIIGIAEVEGGLFNKNGIDVEALSQYRQRN